MPQRPLAQPGRQLKRGIFAIGKHELVSFSPQPHTGPPASVPLSPTFHGQSLAKQFVQIVCLCERLLPTRVFKAPSRLGEMSAFAVHSVATKTIRTETSH